MTVVDKYFQRTISIKGTVIDCIIWYFIFKVKKVVGVFLNAIQHYLICDNLIYLISLMKKIKYCNYRFRLKCLKYSNRAAR